MTYLTVVKVWEEKLACLVEQWKNDYLIAVWVWEK
jgi:hypothetical protein